LERVEGWGVGMLILKRILIVIFIIWFIEFLISLAVSVPSASGEEQQKYNWYFISGYNGAPADVGNSKQ